MGTKRWFGWPLALSIVTYSATASAQDEMDPNLVAELLDFDKLLIAGILFAAAVLVSRVLSAGLDRIGERLATRRLLLKRIASLTRFAVYILVTIFVVFGVIQPERDTLLALATALGVMIGFALKDLASSIIAGLIVLVDSPFQVGDRVQFGDTYGEVTEIGLRTVKITTLDDNLVSIPNNKFLTEVVSSANAGALDMMVVLDFHIGIDEDLNLARKIVYEATITSRYIFLEKPVFVHSFEVVVGAHMAMRVRSMFYVIDTRYELEIKTDITERVRNALQEAGVRAPYQIKINIDDRARTSPQDAKEESAVEVREESNEALLQTLLQEVRALKARLPDEDVDRAAGSNSETQSV